MWIMGLHQYFDEAVRYVATVDFFETVRQSFNYSAKLMPLPGEFCTILRNNYTIPRWLTLRLCFVRRTGASD